ncbi:MAG TPA: hypothetical protein VMP10_01620 [Chloroflexota bacterium]|nr:hypothetical protein [Chloroflexota bacterium]
MRILKGILGSVLVLTGLVWIGQGFNVLLGSIMSGQPIYAALGLVVAMIGVWLLASAARSARQRDV